MATVDYYALAGRPSYLVFGATDPVTAGVPVVGTQVSGNLYRATVPTLPAGSYFWSSYIQVGGSPDPSADIRLETEAYTVAPVPSPVVSAAWGGVTTVEADPAVVYAPSGFVALVVGAGLDATALTGRLVLAADRSASGAVVSVDATATGVTVSAPTADLGPGAYRWEVGSADLGVVAFGVVTVLASAADPD